MIGTLFFTIVLATVAVVVVVVLATLRAARADAEYRERA